MGRRIEEEQMMELRKDRCKKWRRTTEKNKKSES